MMNLPWSLVALIFLVVSIGLEFFKKMGMDAHLVVLGIAVLTIFICLFLWKREEIKEKGTARIVN